MFLVTSSMQSATWGWASTQIGCSVDIDNVLGYASGTTIYIKESSLPVGKTPIVNQYLSFIYYTRSSSSMPIITAVGAASGGYIPCTLNIAQGNIGSSTNPVSINIYSLNAKPLDNTLVTGATTGDLAYTTVAPNGLLYVPFNITENGTSNWYTGLLIIDPGQSNHKKPDGSIQYSFTKTKIYIAKANGTASRPNTTNSLGSTARDRFYGKGVLAPNGLIYFMPCRATEMMVLNPGTGIVNDQPDCTWELINLTTTTPAVKPSGNYMNIGGAVLDKLNADIYGIASNSTAVQPTFRIRPRSSITWTNPNNTSTTNDVFQLGYYTGVVGRRVFSNSPLAGGTGVTGNNGVTFKGGIIDPNPSSNLIYLTPGGYNEIGIIDPNAWGTSNEYTRRPNTVLDMSVNIPTWNDINTQTSNQLRIKYSSVHVDNTGRLNYNYSGKSVQYGISGIYWPTICWNIIVDTNYSSSNLFTSTKLINTLGGRPNNQIVTTVGTVTTSPPDSLFIAGAVLPNGSSLFFNTSKRSFTGYGPPYPSYNPVYELPSGGNDIKAFAATSTEVPDSHIKFLPSQSADNVKMAAFTGSNGIQGNIIAITKPDAIGKVIVNSRTYLENPIELLAVKGFYIGVKNFEYDQTIIDKTSIPLDLSTLPTHPYNYYGNNT